jgi:hypothetical protein
MGFFNENQAFTQSSQRIVIGHDKCNRQGYWKITPRTARSSRPNLSIISKIINNNRDYFESLGEEFTDAFKKWYKAEYAKLTSPNQTIADILKKHIQD